MKVRGAHGINFSIPRVRDEMRRNETTTNILLCRPYKFLPFKVSTQKGEGDFSRLRCVFARFSTPSVVKLEILTVYVRYTYFSRYIFSLMIFRTELWWNIKKKIAFRRRSSVWDFKYFVGTRFSLVFLGKKYHFNIL